MHTTREVVRMITEGDKAPHFAAKDDQGRTMRLSDFAGKTVVLYFYPKDDTPGCIKEACGFRDDYAPIRKTGAVLLGVSPDGVASHVKFKEKYALPFPLLADEDHTIAEAYGAWVEKTAYGRTFWGVRRSTFVIGPDGRIARAFPRVNPEGHSAEVLAALRG